MEPSKQHTQQVPESLAFLLGEWSVVLRTSAVERDWLASSGCQCTSTQTFAGISGTVEYRVMLYGSHIHGEYRQDSQPARSLLNVLFQRAPGPGDSVELTLASPDGKRHCGVATNSEGSLYLGGPGIPILEAAGEEEIRIPLVPKADARPLSAEAVRAARVSIHRLRPDVWLLVLHYVFSTPSPHPTLLTTEIWHFRREPDDEPGARPELPGVEQYGQKETVTALSMVDLEARLAEVERELEEKRRACEEVTSELAARKVEQEDVEDEIIDLSLASFGLKDSPQPVDPADLPPFLGDTWQRHYRSLLDLVGQVQSLEGEPEELQSEIDNLERELEEIEERLDQGYTSWTEKEYRKAEVVLERPTPVPTSPAKPLLGTDALGRLSEEARKIVETYTRLEQVYSTDQGLRNLDCGPLIATMSKACERILSDFLDPRCRTLLGDPALAALLADPSYVLSIPPEDQHFKIDKGSVRKVLNFLEKPGPVHWSGPRNGAIALMIFGTGRVGDDTAAPLDNPLRLYGDDEDRKALRVELYRLQQIRNGFVHHESAEWTQVQEAKGCFETCLRGLVSVLYGLPPDTSNTG